MTRSQFTAGARRALEAAAHIALAERASDVEPLHLLWALIESESRAAEILAQQHFDCEKAPRGGVAGVERSDEPPETSPPGSERFERVIAEASRVAGLAGRDGEAGTEHLLWGLVAVESPASRILGEHGVNRQSLADLFSKSAHDEVAPLGVDFALSQSEPNPADPVHTLRILDAAANRAREGLRVIEDFTRFALDDAHLTRLLKTLRHDLAAALGHIPLPNLLASRDTAADVGTSISTPGETRRSSASNVVTAAFKRLQEALRTLEEFGKLHSASLGQTVEALRYRVYTLEKAVGHTQLNHDRLAGRNLYLLLTESLCPRGPGPAIRAALEGGVSIVQVREKSMPDRQLMEHGRRVREWTREAGALYIMNDRADLAVLTNADGVHVGQDELTVREARLIVGPDRLVGVSTHTIEQARQAVLDGADYFGVGPVFPSGTKQFDSFAGLEFVRQVAAEIALPWYAIGGISATNLGDVLAAGATRVAVSGAICGSDDPANAARELIARLPSR